MGPDTHHIDFLHEYKEQPHASRRIEILKKHPEIKQLMLANGDFRQVLISLAACILQLTLAFISMSEHLPVLVKVMNNFILGSISGSLIFLNIHEAAHGLLFGPAHPKLNKLMGMILNLFYGIPTYTFFKKHHLDHHKYQGDKDFDIEYPTQLEIKIFNWSPFMRLVWLQFNATFMQIRGYFLGPRKIDLDDIINISTVLLVDIWLIQSGYFWIFSFLLGSAFAATGMGLIGTWGLIVHTVYFKEEDTMSYYGWMNGMLFNAGYHMEHHDFPNIPARFLPKVRQMAPEFYKNQHQLDSFYSPVFKFMFDPNTGIHSRIKRSIPSLEKDKLKLH